MIEFAYHDITWRFHLEAETAEWLLSIAQSNGRQVLSLNYIFASDDYVLYLNKKYLEHDTYTDILTFDYSEAPEQPISGDIFISIERIEENAQEYKVPFVDELHRVMVHGLLHILGWDDQSDDDRTEMRRQEDIALKLRMF